MNTLTQTITVNSTAIKSAQYITSENRLRLSFKNNHEYDYFNVPLHLFDGLVAVASKGQYINKYIIGEFKFKKY